MRVWPLGGLDGNIGTVGFGSEEGPSCKGGRLPFHLPISFSVRTQCGIVHLIS